MYRYRRSFSKGIDAPNPVEQLISAENDIWIRREEQEKIKFFIRQYDFFSVHIHTPRKLFDPKSSCFNYFIFILYPLAVFRYQPFITIDMCRYSRNQFTWAEWFNDIIIRAKP